MDELDCVIESIFDVKLNGDVTDDILSVYAKFQFVSSVVVGITYPLVKLNTPVVLV